MIGFRASGPLFMHLPPYILEAAVLGLGLLLLLAELFINGDKRVLAWTGVAGLLVVLAASYSAHPVSVTLSNSDLTSSYQSFYSLDAPALFFKRFALITTAVVLLMSVEYLGVIRKFTPGASKHGGLGEFLALPVLTCAGLMWMVSAVDFVMIFVSLELVTISFYVLVSYTRRNAASLEAGVKYLILGALSTGFLVYGITWIFGITGQTNLAAVSVALARLYPEGATVSTAPVMFAFFLITVALGFKIAAVPFQIWVPDVYQGAPTPVAAFLSVGSKAAGFIVFMRVLLAFFYAQAIAGKISGLLVTIAAATLIYGNLAALPQNNLKRLLAYSSIAHAGYLLIAVASAASMNASPSASVGVLPSEAVSFYLAAYLPMTLLSFLVMIIVANHSAGDDIADYNGLSKRSPFLAFAMLTAMASLAGLPLTAGFIGKFLVFYVALAQKQFLLCAIGVITVGCGFYYYLRVVRAMYFQSTAVGQEAAAPIPVGLVSKITIAILIAAIFVLGIYPLPALGGGLAKPTVSSTDAPVAMAHHP